MPVRLKEDCTHMGLGLFTDQVSDHFLNPRNVGELEHPDGIGIAGDPICLEKSSPTEPG